jgi:hypothetical protein
MLWGQGVMKCYNSPCTELQRGTFMSVVEYILVEKSSRDDDTTV